MENQKEQLNSSKYELFILISEISAALWVHIMAFETTLREFISEKLQKVYGVMEWWFINDLLSNKDLNDVNYAISRLDNRKLPINNENITSNLSLSFWVELHNAGLEFTKNKQFQLALDCYNKILKITPNDVETLYKKSIALENLCKYDKAVQCYDAILKIKPDFQVRWIFCIMF